MFASCFTIDKLVGKLNKRAQTRWFYYKAEHPNQEKHKAFEAWLEGGGEL